jgi:hypothetical protein
VSTVGTARRKVFHEGDDEEIPEEVKSLVGDRPRRAELILSSSVSVGSVVGTSVCHTDPDVDFVTFSTQLKANRALKKLQQEDEPRRKTGRKIFRLPEKPARLKRSSSGYLA